MRVLGPLLILLAEIAACGASARPPTQPGGGSIANAADADADAGAALRVSFITLDRLISRYGLVEGYWSAYVGVETSGGKLRRTDLLAAADRALSDADASALRHLATLNKVDARGVWVDEHLDASADLPAVIGATPPRDRAELAAAFAEGRCQRRRREGRGGRGAGRGW
jgi:hypothetical protein